MKVGAEIALKRWPYGLEVLASDEGLYLRPRRKARAGWAKAFKDKPSTDELRALRQVVNSFDHQEWEW